MSAARHLPPQQAMYLPSGNKGYSAPPQPPAPILWLQSTKQCSAAMNPWNRATLIPQQQHHPSMVISPIEFRYPGKQMFPPPNSGYQVAGMEENRDLYYQVIIFYA